MRKWIAFLAWGLIAFELGGWASWSRLRPWGRITYPKDKTMTGLHDVLAVDVGNKPRYFQCFEIEDPLKPITPTPLEDRPKFQESRNFFDFLRIQTTAKYGSLYSRKVHYARNPS